MTIPKIVPLQLTLLDGTVVRVGDTVRAKGEDGHERCCKVLEILKGCGVDKAILTVHPTVRQPKSAHFVTVIRTRYQIKARRKKK